MSTNQYRIGMHGVSQQALIGVEGSASTPEANKVLREDGTSVLREDGSYVLREG